LHPLPDEPIAGGAARGPTTEVLRVTVPRAEAELVAGELWAAGTVGVREIDNGPYVVLEAAFPTAAATASVASSLRRHLSVEVVAVDDGWRDEWKRYAVPHDAGRRLRVVPAWRPGPAPVGRLALRIDPGACFGSGSHPTTQTLLDELDGLLRGGEHVLDVGTGSGILAVAAARLGAAEVVGIDLDPDATAVVTANAEANGVASIVAASTTPLADVPGAFDVVLANLSALTLVELAPDLMRVTATQGRLLLSGMLDGQWEHVAPAFDAMSVASLRSSGGWTTAVLGRR
jgi:ribosomal protein L11 methyltransferase